MAKNPNTHVDFICIGAQKAGTTWLFSRLNELSEFSLPYIKELHYFDRSPIYPSSSFLAEKSPIKRFTNKEWLKLAKKRIPKRFKGLKKVKWFSHYFFSRYDDAFYLSLFKNLEGIKGEITPSYSILNDADVKKMHTLLPNTKIILLLRNPIDRAWSHFRFHLTKQGIQDYSTIDIKYILDFFEKEDQVLRSDYIKTINTYSKYYPKDQFMIGFYDAITENPKELLTDIVSFIGGDTTKIDAECDLQAKDNVSVKFEMPEEVKSYLKNKYTKDLKVLSDKLGSYATQWHNMQSSL